MQHPSIRNHTTRQPLRSLPALALMPACLCLAACSSDELSLGAGDGQLELGDPPSCGYHGSGIVVGDITARNQDELDALAGCEEVLGTLTVFGSSELDLRSLASLRLVRGPLIIGEGEADVPSLEGLEALEEVESLAIRNLQSADLLPLSRLTSVYGSQPGGPGQLNGGQISISKSPQLQDLTGLEGLREWSGISLSETAALSSLNGLGTPGAVLASVIIHAAPALRDLSALAEVRALGELSLVDTGLESLRGLDLLIVDSLSVADNANLIEMDDAFVNAQAVRSWGIIDNPKLDHLPEGPSLGAIETLRVMGNDSLRSIPVYTFRNTPRLSLGLGGNGDNPDSATATLDDFTVVEIAYNPALTRFSIPLRFREGTYVGIYANANLTELDLEALSSVDMLSIRDNPVLSSLDLGDLQTVDNLAIENNPALSVAELAQVETFDRTIVGNADAPADAIAP